MCEHSPRNSIKRPSKGEEEPNSTSSLQGAPGAWWAGCLLAVAAFSGRLDCVC